MNRTERQRMLGLVAGAALAVFVGDQVVVTPLIRAWKARSERLVELRKKVTQGTALLERERTLRDRWSSMRTNALSREISVAESQMLKAFDRWSQESGVGISGLRPQWKRDSRDQLTLECRADAFGTLSGLSRFLFLLDQDPLGVRLESFEITTRDPGGQQLNLVLQVSGIMQPGSGS